MAFTSRPAVAQRSRATAVRAMFAALFVGLFAVVGVAPAEAAGGGRYTSLDPESNGPIAIYGRGADGTYLARTLEPRGRTDAAGFASVSSVGVSARTTVAITCYLSQYDSFTLTYENPDRTGVRTRNACADNQRMVLRVRVFA